MIDSFTCTTYSRRHIWIAIGSLDREKFMRKHGIKDLELKNVVLKKCGSKDLYPLTIKIWLTRFEYNEKQMEDIPQRCHKNPHI